jgi:D-alanyl-D-alanine carboxypeptidase/D-alanyl-D-alanine-endopeptidase (penicillin-binding protein 4)
MLAPAAAAQAQTAVGSQLASAMRHAARSSGAYVLDATTNQVLFQSRATTPRILASNTKLFTSSAILAKLGSAATFATQLESTGSADPTTGVFTGDIYLRGGGDPTFGTSSFVRRFFGGNGSKIEDLAQQLTDTGITEIKGRIIGDESRFDSLRGGPTSHFGFSSDLGGPLSALTFDRGLANEHGSAIQGNPPLFAAQRLQAALKGRHIKVTRTARAGVTPDAAKVLASVESPPLSTILQLQNKESDNFFAETMVKDLVASDTVTGSTRAGAAAAAAFARRLGARVRMSDGSGLSRSDQASPKDVVKLLDKMRQRDPDEFNALLDSLPVAGRDGTLDNRMRNGAARGRCHAKTGTLRDASALSGYCFARGGHVMEFSLLMNHTSVFSARAVQDRMTNAIAAFTGAGTASAAVSSTITMSAAKAVAGAFASDCGACQAGVTECARVTPTRRIDCVVAENGSCSEVVSVRLSGQGYLLYDLYPCKSQAPTTAAVQVQASPPGGLHYEPLTPAAFEFAADVYPKHLGYPAYPVRHYVGSTSQKGERANVWLTRKHQVLTGSGVQFSSNCFSGFQFVPLAGARLSHGGTVLDAHRAHAGGGRPAFKLHATVTRRRLVGTLRLLNQKCVHKPISFSLTLRGHPGF